MLACLAHEVLSRDQKVFRRVQTLAHEGADYGAAAAAVGMIEAVHFLVVRAMKKTWGFDVEAIQPFDRNFARTYLYPYKDQYRGLVTRCLKVPGVWQRLLGL